MWCLQGPASIGLKMGPAGAVPIGSLGITKTSQIP